MPRVIALFVCIAIGSIVAVFQTYKTNRKLRKTAWRELVAMLEMLPIDGIKAVALDHLEPGPGQMRIKPKEMWELVGGFEGLSSMYFNTRVLCALASHAERWDPEEAFVVTLRVRMEAWTVRVAILSLFFRSMIPSIRLNRKVPSLLHQAAASYYLLSTRVLSLYETTHSARLNVLKTAM